MKKFFYFLLAHILLISNIGFSQTVVIANGSTNPVYTATAPSSSANYAIVPIVSSTVESGHVLKASAGNLYSIYVNSTVTGLLMVFNSTTVPADGAVTPIECVSTTQIGNNFIASINYSPGPASSYSTGISVAYSTGTNCFNKTASATAFFHGTVQ